MKHTLDMTLEDDRHLAMVALSTLESFLDSKKKTKNWAEHNETSTEESD